MGSLERNGCIGIGSSFETRLFIDGEFVEASSGRFFSSINPATEEEICQLQEASAEDVDKAVAAASRAFETWQFVDGRVRGKLLSDLADLIESNAEQLAQLESLDSGKPIAVTRSTDLAMVLDALRYYSGWADKIQGKSIPIEGGASQGGNQKYLCFTKHEPVGVVAQVIPWNFPLIMAAWKIAPAIAAGCTMILKPSEKTPLSALMLAQLIQRAGFPPGVINVLVGFGPTVGNFLVRHRGVNKVAFTGSTASGTKVLVAAAETGLKRTTLELGGKSPLIIFEDADLEQAVKVAHLGLFFNMGQCCIASTRIFVHESVHQEFVEKMILLCKEAKLLPPQDENCTHGPQIDKIQFDIITDYIACGKQEGAKCMALAANKPSRGYWIEPTMFVDVEDHMKIAKEEIFGPVMCIMKFSTTEEVIRRANDTEFGLGAGVCCRDIGKAMSVMNKLRAGTIFLNCYDVLSAAAPFGGYKQSGQGREMGEYGLNPYLEVKTVIADISYHPSP